MSSVASPPIGVFLATFLPIVIDSRYGLPSFPLLAAPCVLAVVRLHGATRRRPVLLALAVVGAAIWVWGMVSTALWLDTYSPMLRSARASMAARPPAPTAAYSLNLPEDWEPGQLVTIPITVTNTGPDDWSLEGFFNVALRVQILATKTEQHRLLPKGARVYVNPTASIAPGESASFLATVETPTATGRYILTATMIRTGIEEEAPGFEQAIRVDKGR
jgi:hypothetical protein